MGQEAGKTTSGEDKKSTGDASVRIALITGIVTIVVALLSSPLLTKLLEPKPTSLPIPISLVSPVSATETATSIQPTFTDTPIVESIFSATPIPLTNSPEFTPTTPSNLAPGMRVIITASRTSGKAPLSVNFNASDSYLIAVDGTVVKCGACSFTWSIRFGSNFIFGPEKKDATFGYKFGKKGTYFVILQVCRNGVDDTCGTSGINIVVN